jgi:RNA polymerase sigma-70 factor (ECF subfamily)
MSYLRLVPSSSNPPVTSDEACLGAFQQELNYVFRTLRRLGTAPSELEDLAQDVFLALRHSWNEYDPARPLRPYLFGIAFRLASAHHRKRAREVVFGVVHVLDARPPPDEAMQTKQMRALMLVALEKIPLPRRAVLVMAEFDDVPVREVASVLGIPLFTAYSRLRKARRELESTVRRLLREIDLK